jgi:sialate O-acetylesterase
MLRKARSFLLFVLLFSPLAKSFSQVRLPQIIRDSMVLQRDTKINIWGWASPKEKVTITFNGKRQSTNASSEGKWKLVLPAMKADGPYIMNISGKNEIILKDILIGDIWFCSGQSNMVHQMNIHDVTYANDIHPDNPNLYNR